MSFDPITADNAVARPKLGDWPMLLARFPNLADGA